MGYFKKEDKTEFAEMMERQAWTLSDTVDAMAKRKPGLSCIIDAKVKTWKKEKPFNAPKIKAQG